MRKFVAVALLATLLSAMGGPAAAASATFDFVGQPFGAVVTQLASDVGENVIVVPTLVQQTVTLHLVGVSPHDALHAAELLVGATEVRQKGYILIVPALQAAQYGGDASQIYPIESGDATFIAPMLGGILGNTSSVQALSSYSLLVTSPDQQTAKTVLGSLEGSDIGVDRVPMTARMATQVIAEMQALDAIPPMSMAVAEVGDGAIDIRGSAKARAALKKTISALDVARPAVRFLVDVISVTPEAYNSVRGILWGQSQSSIVSGQLPSIIPGQTQTTFQGNYLPIAIQINELISEGKAHLYKSTSVDMAQGDTVSVHVGENVPIVTQTGGALNPQSQVTFYPIGILLRLNPSLVANNQVVAHMDVDDSDILSTDRNGVPTVATTTIAGGSYTVTHGNAVVLIGYDQDSSATNVVKIPVLGDLPLLGGLFRQRTEEVNKQHLIFVVRPEVCPCKQVNPNTEITG